MQYYWIVQHRVDQCHVGQSHRAVLRDFMTCCKGGRKQYLALPRDQRRNLTSQIFARHSENRNLYHNAI